MITVEADKYRQTIQSTYPCGKLGKIHSVSSQLCRVAYKFDSGKL